MSNGLNDEQAHHTINNKREFCNRKVRKKVADVWNNGRDFLWRIERWTNYRISDNFGIAFKNHKLETKIIAADKAINLGL